MKNKPIIGIIGKVQPKYDEDLWHIIDEVDEIRYLIVKNGGIAITLLPTEATMKFNDNDIKDEKKLNSEEIEGLYKQIELCDGFILQGGLYSCKYEIEIAKKVIELDKPLIGICAGFNNILRALGSDVILDKNKSHDIYDKNYRHKIKIEKSTELYKLIEKEETYNKEHYEYKHKSKEHYEDRDYERKHYDDYDDKYYKDNKYHRKRKRESFMGEIFDIFGGGDD